MMMGMQPTSLNSLVMIAANNKAFMKSKWIIKKIK